MSRPAKLYVILGSHACRAGMLMLEHKRIAYQPVEIPTGLQAPALWARRFPGRTVPALTIDGRRVQTNRQIGRFLDELRPAPPLFPSDPAHRREVREAERFADGILQTIARRLVLAAGSRDLKSLAAAGGSGRLGPILARSERRRARIMRIAVRYFFKITAQAEAADLAALPTVLDQVDAWIEAGVLGGPELSAADLQIVPSLCLLGYRSELRPEVESRPAWALADRVIPALERAPRALAEAPA